MADNPQVVGGASDYYVEKHSIFTIIPVLTGSRIAYQNGGEFQPLDLVGIGHDDPRLKREIVTLMPAQVQKPQEL